MRGRSALHIGAGVHFYVPISPFEIAVLLGSLLLIARSLPWQDRLAPALFIFLAMLGTGLTGSAVFAVAIAGVLVIASRMPTRVIAERYRGLPFARECAIVLAGISAYEIARTFIESGFATAHRHTLQVVDL